MCCPATANIARGGITYVAGLVCPETPIFAAT